MRVAFRTLERIKRCDRRRYWSSAAAWACCCSTVARSAQCSRHRLFPPLLMSNCGSGLSGARLSITSNCCTSATELDDLQSAHLTQYC